MVRYPKGIGYLNGIGYLVDRLSGVGYPGGRVSK